MKSYRTGLLAAALAGLAGGTVPAQTLSSSGVDLKAMDTSVSPCTNFYQYACGNWRKNNPIPPDQARWGRFNELAEKNLAVEHDILIKAADGGAERSAVEQKIGDFYAACMDEKAINAAGVQPIEPVLKRIRAVSSKQDLPEQVSRMQKEGVRVLFNFYSNADEKDALHEIANADQGGLGLPDRDYYLKKDPKSVELRQKYQQHIQRMFGLLAQAEGQPSANAEADAATVMKIETALAQNSLDRVSRRNPDNTYHKMPLADFEKLTPSFDWPKYLTASGDIPQIQSLNVAVPAFFTGLDTLLKDTSLDDLKTYFTWHVLTSYAGEISDPFVNENFDFYGKTLTGAKELQVRWKRCVRTTDRALGEAVGQKYVEVAFSAGSRERMLKMVGQIESAMEQDIQTATWMTPATKTQAMAKLKTVENKIGYPEKWRDYTKVDVKRGDFLGDVQRATAFEVARNQHKIGGPVDKQEWGMTPPTVNAYYNSSENNINFPAGILQPPFFNPKADDAVNYGAIGVVIGHELTHGFDDQGRRYDSVGNLRDWWTPEDAKAFESRADCVVNEYGGFESVQGVKLNGKLTLGENAADNGGIHLAYMALMAELAGKVLPPKDGLTPQQQFFLGFAQVWCENQTEQSLRLRAATDPHSPGEFRVNGVVQNTPEFGKAYGCSAGQPMVSQNACRVW